MGSLIEVHVPQNGIKDQGMTQLLRSLAFNKDLKTLRVNDNWLKSDSTEQLLRLLLSCPQLEELNISDGNMGTANVLIALRALQKSSNKNLKAFSCNYNDVESKKAVTECLEILVSLGSVKEIDFVGSGQSKTFKSSWFVKFAEAGKNIRLFDEGEEEEEADENEDEEEEDNHDYENDLEELSQKLE
jgi:Ran GTPase-activating protein 1